MGCRHLVYHPVCERRRFPDLVKKLNFQEMARPGGHKIGFFPSSHCQTCFVYPPRRSISPILPNKIVSTSLNHSILTPSPKGLEAGLRSRATGVIRPLRRFRTSHADGAVVEGIDTIEHSTRVINVVYIIVLYAFTQPVPCSHCPSCTTAGGSWACRSRRR